MNLTNKRSEYSNIDYVRVNEERDAVPVNISSSGCRLFGYVRKPGKRSAALRPCILMFYGFPENTVRSEMEYTLVRMGYVVLHLNYRGVWGSGGTFLLSQLPEDVCAAAAWINREENAAKYGVDRNNIFLAGHGIGGTAVLNAVKELPFIRGVAAAAPFDPEACFQGGMGPVLIDLLEQNRLCLRMSSVQAVYEDAVKNRGQLGLLKTAVDLKDRNVLLVGGIFDRISPPAVTLYPVIKKIRSLGGQGTCHYTVLNTNHSLCGQGMVFEQTLRQWITDTVSYV